VSTATPDTGQHAALVARLSSGATSEAIVADCLCELTLLTKMSNDEWVDFLSLPPNAQLICLDTYKSQDWTQSPDVLGKILVVLGVIGTVAGVVTGVAGAAGAVAALKTL